MPGHPAAALQDQVGQEIVVSEWHTVTQEEVNRFAEATHDHQWIHVDVERAKRESPFKAPVAHGFYTLSLLPHFMGDFFNAPEIRQGVNYGCNKVRFPAPVPVGSRLRGRFTLKEVESGPMGAIKVTVQATVEMQGADKPACVAEQVFLLFV